MRERSTRSPRVRAISSTAALDAREHPQAEQVDLQEARVRAGVLVPLAQLAALHRRRQHRAAVDQRPGGDDHPARVLGEVARQPVGLVAQPRQPRPAAGQRGAAALVAGPRLVVVGPPAVDHRLPLGGRHRERRARVRIDQRRRRAARLQPERRLDVGRHAAHRPRLGPARDALELARRQPEHLAQLADRPARAERRERRHQRRALAPVAVVDARDQDLADVAREVEVDVRQRGELLVEEAPEEEVVGHRVDVREAGEVADDRGHGGAAAAPRRQQRARRVRPAHLDRHLARQLEQVAVQEEEAGQAEPVDHAQLLLEPRVGGGAVRAAAAGSARPAPPSTARPACGRPPGPPSPGSGSRGRRVRSKRSRSASAAASATARGWSSKRAAIAAGEASTCDVLPRRSGSDASSVVWLRSATKASCSGARARACAWTLPVATAASPSRCGQPGQAAGCARGRRAGRAAGARRSRLSARRRRAAAAASARRARRGARSRSGTRARRRAPRSSPAARPAAARPDRARARARA